MHDIHGNMVREGDNVYIMAASIRGSKAMRLLYGEVTSIEGRLCTVLVFENDLEYKKTSATIVKPQERERNR
jgi:hypothetical protein